jgi:hypothetical protein
LPNELPCSPFFDVLNLIRLLISLLYLTEISEACIKDDINIAEGEERISCTNNVLQMLLKLWLFLFAMMEEWMYDLQIFSDKMVTVFFNYLR